MPDELGTDDTDGALTNAFSGSVYIAASGSTTDGDNKAFTIVFTKLSREACITLATNDWGSGYSSGLIALKADGSDMDDATVLDDVFIGNGGTENSIATPGGDIQPIPMAVTAVATACSCKEGNTCSIAWKYY